MMRFDTNAMRVRYGVPIFVTFSPDEAHNLLMVRLSRTRRNDTVFSNGNDTVGRKYCTREQPSTNKDLDTVEFPVTVEEIMQNLPSHDERREILARDSLASVDGFRTLVLAAYEHLFGVRVCVRCPDCNHHEHGTSPC